MAKRSNVKSEVGARFIFDVPSSSLLPTKTHCFQSLPLSNHGKNTMETHSTWVVFMSPTWKPTPVCVPNAWAAPTFHCTLRMSDAQLLQKNRPNPMDTNSKVMIYMARFPNVGQDLPTSACQHRRPTRIPKQRYQGLLDVQLSSIHETLWGD